MMRPDAIGMFWQDLEQKAERGSREAAPKVLPPIPNTGWVAPDRFPDLSSADALSIDVETKDLELEEKGPGVRRGAHIVGLAVGTIEGGRWYFPMRHEVAPEQNLDPANVIAWAKDNLCDPKQPKVGANLLYDLDFLAEEGVHVRGRCEDVQIAEPLLDENRYTYALDSLGKKHLGEGKVKNDLAAWVKQAYGGSNYRKNIWRAPPCLVGPYAEGDVDLPFRILEKQKLELEKENLLTLFDIESRVTPMLLAMRRRGVRVDLARAQQLDDELTVAIKTAQNTLDSAAGSKVNVNAAADLARMFDKAGVAYPKTAKGNPSFVKEWLEHHMHPACMMVVEVRKLTKYRDTFIRGYIFGCQINGRIYCEFHQAKSDDNGTVSGRFSSSNPNLQNIPSRDKIWGPKLRSIFIPEEGETWYRHDWSQIEYRFLAHFGIGANAEEVREMYRTNPETDFHEMVIQMTGLERKPAKTVNFGLVYGMGPPTLAGQLGMSVEEATTKVFEPYHAKVPFVRETFDYASQLASRRGYVKTILGRRGRFPMWTSTKWDGEREALPELAAREKWGNRIMRAFTHKALNKVLQGSAADLMKKAMVEIWEAGICDVIGPPLLTVHDELDDSVGQEKAQREAIAETKRIMETCMTLKVPIIAEAESGPNWGECK